MARRRWIQNNGQLIEVTDGTGSGGAGNSPSTPAIFGDLPDFVSPIDGSIVSGRANLREHCLKHNVVPTADLKGLPPKTMNQEYKPDREATRRTIAEIINSRTY